MTATAILPDDATLRFARRARVLQEMEAAGVDILVVGQEANARYVSGTPRLWTAGAKGFGAGCVLVAATGAVHLLSTWDEGVPDEIPHEHLYGITFNGQNFLRVLQGVEGAASARTVATDTISAGGVSLLGAAFPNAELVDAEALLTRARSVKTPEEVGAIREAVAVAERALAAAEAVLAPGCTERQLTGVFMEAMAAAGVTTPSSQDVAWRTSRTQPWGRDGRDAPVAAGDLVALEGGVLRDGYLGELGRTVVVGGDAGAASALFGRWSDLRDRLVAACVAGTTGPALLDVYTSTGNPLPPVPVARGLGLGFDLPLVTAALPGTAGEQRLEAGMVLAVTSHVWEEGIGSVLGHEPLVVTENGPELLSSTSTANRGAS